MTDVPAEEVRARLTDAERRLLKRLQRRGHPESSYSMAPNVVKTGYRLERRGFVSRHKGNFALTDAGRAALLERQP